MNVVSGRAPPKRTMAQINRYEMASLPLALQGLHTNAIVQNQIIIVIWKRISPWTINVYVSQLVRIIRIVNYL